MGLPTPPPVPSPTPSEPWRTTRLSSGPLDIDCYKYNIPSTGTGIGVIQPPLSANTIYEYRAYITVGGSAYYGDSCIISTLPIETSVPTVDTGTACNITCTTMRICNNNVTDKGNLCICEYGVLYNQSAGHLLTYGNLSACVKSICADIATGTTYFTSSTCEITGLNDNTTTFYRAFAINDCGVGYGNICCAQTLCSPEICIYFENLCVHSCINTLVCLSVNLALSCPLTAGQQFRLCFCNTACSCSNTIIRAASACAYINGCQALSCISDMTNGNCYDSITGHIDINCNTVIGDYCFYTVARTHIANVAGGTDYTNCAHVCLCSIANQVGGNYIIDSVRDLFAFTCLEGWGGGLAGPALET